MTIKRRAAINEFSREMEIQLRKNDYKGSWSGCGPQYFLSRLYEELRQLTVATALGSQDKIRDECVEIANFAMMIWDNSKSCDGLNDK